MSVMDLNAQSALVEVVKRVRPDEIYYLAAHHFSSQGGENISGIVYPFISINLLAVNSVLELIKDEMPDIKFFYAASSQIFGLTDESPQRETTPHRPNSPYSISKSTGFYLCRYYREFFGVYSSVGILYNHESPYRSIDFVSTQIARAAALAHLGRPEPLHLRDMDAVVDWGAAEDYVVAMWLTLQQGKGDEYIISSGVPHTVRDFAKEAFGYVGIDYGDCVPQYNNGNAASEYLPYVGDNSKIRNICKWQPQISFEQLVRSMVDYQSLSIQKGQE
jgi:GDPmannose 4,6-dehydratase